MSNYSKEDRLWIENVAVGIFSHLREHFSSIVFWSIVACIVYIVFQKLSLPVIHPYFKKCLRFEQLLDEMKNQLEQGIPESKQNDPKVLKTYLDLYSTFRELRVAAKRDHNDKIDHRESRWRKFDRIKLPEYKRQSATVTQTTTTLKV